jgi:hypothetical protein
MRRWVTLLSEASAELLSAVQHVQRAAVDKMMVFSKGGVDKGGGRAGDVLAATTAHVSMLATVIDPLNVSTASVILKA